MRRPAPLPPSGRLPPWVSAMRRANCFAVAAISVAVALSSAEDSAVRADDFEAAPIRYSASTPDNPISRLQAKLDAGKAKLEYDDHFGYLRAVLEALKVSPSSQMLVFSKTSLQRQRIAPQT